MKKILITIILLGVFVLSGCINYEYNCCEEQETNYGIEEVEENRIDIWKQREIFVNKTIDRNMVDYKKSQFNKIQVEK